MALSADDKKVIGKLADKARNPDGELKIEEMNVGELKHWLTSKDEAPMEWRLDPKNEAAVAFMVSRYTGLPGGEAPHIISAKLHTEKEHRNYELANEKDRQRVQQELERYCKEDFLKTGGHPNDWEETWVEVQKELKTNPSKKRKILEAGRSERRRRAASTW